MQGSLCEPKKRQHYFTSRKGIWYTTPEGSFNFKKLSKILLKRKSIPSIGAKNEEILQTWANSNTRAARQRTVRQEMTIAKMGILPHLYASKISEVIESTKEYEYNILDVGT